MDRGSLVLFRIYDGNDGVFVEEFPLGAGTGKEKVVVHINNVVREPGNVDDPLLNGP